MRFLLLFLLLPSFVFSDAPIDATHHIRVGFPANGLVNGISRVLVPPNFLSSGTNAGNRQSGGFGWLGDFVSTGMASITYTLGSNFSQYFSSNSIPNNVSYLGIYKTTATGDIIMFSDGIAMFSTGIGLSTGTAFRPGAKWETMGTKIIGFSQGVVRHNGGVSELISGQTRALSSSVFLTDELFFISSPTNNSSRVASVSTGDFTLTNGDWVPPDNNPYEYVIFPTYGPYYHINPKDFSRDFVNVSAIQLGEDFAIFIETLGYVFVNENEGDFSRGNVKQMVVRPSDKIISAAAYKNRAFVLTSSGTLQWSNALDVSSFPVVNFQRVNDSYGSKPLALINYGKTTPSLMTGYLAVINERSITLINGTNFDPTTPDWSLTEIPLPSNMRLVSRNANVLHNGLLYCAEKRGIVVFDGEKWLRPYSHFLSGTFENNMGQGLVASLGDTPGGDVIHSAVSWAGNIFASLSVLIDGTTNYQAVNFMIDREDKFWLRGNPNRSTNTFVNSYFTPLVVQNDKLVALIQDTTNWYLMQWSNDPTIGRTTGTDFPFIATFSPVPTDDLSTKKQFIYCIPQFSTDRSTITFSYRVDEGSWKNTDIYPPSASGLIHRSRIDIGQVGNAIEFKIEQAAAAGKHTDRNFRFLGVDLWYKTRDPSGEK